MIGIVSAAKLGEWQHWPATTEAQIAATPIEIKREWGERFKVLAPQSSMLLGPAGTFDIVCALVSDGTLEIRAKVDKAPMGRHRWVVEFKLAEEKQFMVAHDGA